MYGFKQFFLMRCLVACLMAACAAQVFAQAALAADAWCARIAPRIPVVTAQECGKLNLSINAGSSVRGMPIMMREQPAAAPHLAADAPRVLLIGGIHGDELTAPAAVLRWANWLDRDQAPQFHWRIAPLMNPDGLLARPATRANASGVDLNRNFPTPGWAAQAPVWWNDQARRDPRRYPGKAAGSEPETQWLMREIARFQPDVIVSVHAPFGVLDYDGPAPLAVSPPRNLGRLYLDKIGVYPGSLGNYGGVHKGIAVLTIELPHAMNLPNDLELGRIWGDLLKWIDDYHRRSRAVALTRAPDKAGVRKNQ